jgi:hypothetical protein
LSVCARPEETPNGGGWERVLSPAGVARPINIMEDERSLIMMDDLQNLEEGTEEEEGGDVMAQSSAETDYSAAVTLFDAGDIDACLGDRGSREAD